MGIGYHYDPDLEFLRLCDEEDLQQLASYLIYDKDGRRRRTSSILGNERFQALSSAPDQWRQCWELIAGELQHFGGDTLVNLVRRRGVPYREILRDVCGRLKVDHDKKGSTYEIEDALIASLVEKSWDAMSEAERRQLQAALNLGASLTAASLPSILAALKTAKASLVVASWLAKAAPTAFGMSGVGGLGMGTVATIVGTRSVGMFAGPLAAVVVTVPMLSGPAYRVTVPAVIQVAYMRRQYEQKERFQ